MGKVRIGMIGAGVHATNMLYPSCEHIADLVERVAVCDLVEQKAKSAARNYGFSGTYTDYQRMLEAEHLDGVIICLNGKLHPSVVMDCLERGVDVLVEKPIAITVKDAREVEEKAKKLRRIVMVEHQKRYSKAYLRAMDLIRKPSFGEVTMIECKMHGRPYETLLNLFLEWHSHGIDIVRAFGGNVKSVTAVKKGLAPNRAAIAAILEFESGAVGTLNFGSEGGFGRFCERLEIIGSAWSGVIIENARDVISYDHDAKDWYQHNTAAEWRQDWLPMHTNFTHAMDGYVGMIRTFAESITTRVQASPSAEDERKALEIIFEILRQLDVPADWKYVASDY
jgi:predicted dehydrogenase